MLLADVHYFLERLTKLRIEDRVNDGIYKAVHVAQPRCQDEGGHARLTVLAQFCAHRVHYVAREKWHPAEQKNACKQFLIGDLLVQGHFKQFDH